MARSTVSMARSTVSMARSTNWTALRKDRFKLSVNMSMPSTIMFTLWATTSTPFSTLLNSTNGNVVVLNTQINLLQTIVNMLPRMVTESLDTILPGAVNAVIGPVMAEIEAQLVSSRP
ncbi:hypothetical protein GGR54DRAFT_84830 [Hypoxylon sp. NC1633]|nr:hypothetical protein GGR54DRAFT_84830 [Hypoxylon sp. NC1633]